ncbi:hypothetical protein [Azospirillum thermophilum]|uniref:Uncharacterized protein n=1 Tax=Azospirillum thermophilum TaxID=2202148 RepID=A0A2S2CKJ1_9PROT|nr:hypothetical protein [Azospirillum thermophilum]AWK85035.1 hypothetical protein DEW08_01515 [Azospirillum thermophilum]
MRDMYSNVAVVEAIAPSVYTADTTPASIDLAGFNAATIVMSIGAGGITFTNSNKIEFVLTHSDDDTTYTNVTASDLLGVTSVSNGIVKALTAAKAASDVTKIGYVGGRRYLKLLADFSGTHGTGTGISAVVVKGHPAVYPTA